MDLVDYSNFLQAKEKFNGIRKILKLYAKQKVAVDSWAQTKWFKLKLDILFEAIEENIDDFLRLDKWV